MNGRMADQKNTTRVFLYPIYMSDVRSESVAARGAHVLSQGPWGIIALNYIQPL